MKFRNDKVALVILDGWGKGRIKKADAIAHAQTPFMDSLLAKYPNAELVTYGEAVGLPNGQMGNSEVGHLNIGAGRIVYQDLLKVNKAIEDKSLFENETLKASLVYALKNKCKVHLMGLVSDGGVHSQISHLKALVDYYNSNGVDRICIHAFTDGRDTDPNGAAGYLKDVSEYIADTNAEIATVIGRYYAMDRDKRWERVKLAYDLLLKGKGEKTDNILLAIEKNYAEGITDEFIKPIVHDTIDGVIETHDIVLCFNFRTDRCREITSVLTQKNNLDFDMHTLPLHYITMTEYDSNFNGVRVIFEDSKLKNTLGAVLEANEKTQLRCAETEKYPHVTFFFSGGEEKPYEGEERILVNSPKVATYDLQAEMSAPDLAQQTADFIEKNRPNFVCLNFANPDMVGHTGVFDAVVKAVETADETAKLVIETAQKNGYSTIIIADHGNADFVLNEDGSPNTAHTKNPVPVIFVDDNYNGNIKSGKLGDLAPTILNILGIDIPKEMNGNNLLSNETNKTVLLISDDINDLENAWALVSEKGFICSTVFSNETTDKNAYNFVFEGKEVADLEGILAKIEA